MDQWITALEKVGTRSHWAGTNRFNSFAPIRLNVSVQWLADGVRRVQVLTFPETLILWP
jgi:phospholipase D1/2